jgi:hypothetical protein
MASIHVLFVLEACLPSYGESWLHAEASQYMNNYHNNFQETIDPHEL